MLIWILFTKIDIFSGKKILPSNSMFECVCVGGVCVRKSYITYRSRKGQTLDLLPNHRFAKHLGSVNFSNFSMISNHNQRPQDKNRLLPADPNTSLRTSFKLSC